MYRNCLGITGEYKAEVCLCGALPAAGVLMPILKHDRTNYVPRASRLRSWAELEDRLGFH